MRMVPEDRYSTVVPTDSKIPTICEFIITVVPTDSKIPTICEFIIG